MASLGGCTGVSEGFAALPQTSDANEAQKQTDCTSSATRATTLRHRSGDCQRSETIAIHGGDENEPTTKARAVPIYQTLALSFFSAPHAAALFNLEVDGFRYTRIGNPTNAVLERRIASLEGGLEALSVASGQAAVNYSVVNLAELGTNIVSVPQLYGTTHTLFTHILPKQGINVRFSETDHPADIERLIDAKTAAGVCARVG